MSEPLDENTRAGIRCLLAVAMADGGLDDAERSEILAMFPNRRTEIEGMLGDTIDLESEVKVFEDDDDFRRRVYRAAFAVAYADGWASTEEVWALKVIYPDEGESTFFGQVMGETVDTFRPTGILPIADPNQRDAEVLEDTFKYAVLSAVFGAMPVPGVAILTDLMVIAFQVKLVRDIGQYWGHDLDAAGAKSLIGTMSFGAGVRIAISHLMKFVPGWGSAFGAASSFAATFAVGRVANAYFASGKTLAPDTMQDLFRAAKAEGSERYKDSQSQIDTMTTTYGSDLTQLRDQLAAGEISIDQASQMADETLTSQD